MRMLILTTLLLSTASFIFAQDWQGPLRWVYEQGEYWPDPEPEYLEIIKIGDTLVHQRACVVLVERLLEVTENGTVDTSTYQPYVMCNQGDTIFYYEEETGQLEVIYRFDLHAGDTLYSYCQFYGSYTASPVDSIGRVTIGGQDKKVLWLSYDNLGHCFLVGPVIEGIGSFFHLLPGLGTVDPPPGGELLCFSDGTLYYPSEDSCALILGTRETGNLAAISLFPNPVSDLATIRGGIVREVKIFDGLGRCLRTLRNTNEVAFDGLPSGVYTLLIRLEGAGYGWFRVVHPGK